MDPSKAKALDVMPRRHKGSNSRDQDIEAAEEADEVLAPPMNGNPALHYSMVKCCTPLGCDREDSLIDSSDPEDAVKVQCNNDMCTVGMFK